MSSQDEPVASAAAPLSGSQFLDELEKKHTHVLDELDALNARIEKVIKMYVQGRQSAGLGLTGLTESNAGNPRVVDIDAQFETPVRKVA